MIKKIKNKKFIIVIAIIDILPKIEVKSINFLSITIFKSGIFNIFRIVEKYIAKKKVKELNTNK